MSSLSSLGSRSLAVNGLATGLNTDQLIAGLLATEQKQITLLRSRQATFAQQQGAFQGIESALLALQGQLTGLARSFNGVFDARQASTSNKDLVTAAASSSAAAGAYTLRVNQLARAHQVASQGFDGSASSITQGTIQLDVGSQTATITIDNTNNTLQGLTTAINNAGVGVTATLVSDGRNQPQRLLLTSSKTGAANVITITNNLAADNGGARRPEFGATFIGQAVTDAGFTGTSAPVANAGAGGYTGASNASFKFTVATGGTVGTDGGIVVNYIDSIGGASGTINVGAGDADVFKSVANGVQVKFGAGTLVAGQTFSIDASVPTVQQAADASVSIGSGAGAVAVTGPSNQLDGVINGVTLSLQGADPGKDVTVSVANDAERAKKAINDFVEAYNRVLDSVDSQNRFDAKTGKAGVLLGNRTATSIQEQVRTAVVNVVRSVNPTLNRLSAAGITTDDDGRLQVNAAKLDDALNGRIAGASYDDLRRLFAFTGSSTNPGVTFITGSTKTKAPANVQVDLTQAATRGFVTGGALAASTVIDATNNTFTLSVDGQSSDTITLANGTYSQQALAQAVQTQVNASKPLAGRAVSVSLDAGKLKLTSNTYGLASEVAIGTGTALGALGFAGGEVGKGQDVVGNFIVDGKVETAVGTGQFLVGNSANDVTADLQVRVTLNEGQVQAGSEATLAVTRGVASRLDTALTGLVDPVNGRLKTVNSGLQGTIDGIKKSIDRQGVRLEARRQALVRQFATLERTVSQLQSSGSFLGAQLSSLRGIS